MTEPVTKPVTKRGRDIRKVHVKGDNPNPSFYTVCGKGLRVNKAKLQTLSLEEFNKTPQRLRCRNCERILNRILINSALGDRS